MTKDEQQPDVEVPQPGPASERGEPDPTVEAPEFVSIAKGWDPRKPNPKRVRETIERLRLDG
ncbi:MAG: hypothetical protein ACE5FJ_02165 [Gemmatimonadales bacterium]